jgi:hypothetical protein
MSCSTGCSPAAARAANGAGRCRAEGVALDGEIVGLACVRVRSFYGRELVTKTGRPALVSGHAIETQKGRIMDAGVGVGDRIVVESEQAAQSGRAGVIEEVLADDPPRLRVRWDDAHTSIVAPPAGVARIERRTKKRVKT